MTPTTLEPVEIFILVIQHRTGLEIWPCESRETALKQLHKYVTEWWEDEMGSRPMPKDHEIAVQNYFEAQVKKALPKIPESYTIHVRDFVTQKSLGASTAKTRRVKKTTKVPRASHGKEGNFYDHDED